MKTEPLILSTLSEPLAILRERFQDFGYLHIKAAVNTHDCEALMQQIIDLLAPEVSFNKASQQPILNGKPFFETDPFFDQVYPDIQALPLFQDIFHQQDMQQAMQIVAGDKVFVYPMKMARISTPRKLGFETPPHQDAHSHQAGNTMAGIWLALHDIGKNMGRLMVLPKSHHQGVRQVTQANGVGGVQCEIFAHEDTWHVSDVEQGDVILFHACCVHKAEPNTSDSVVRLSIDTRFCDYGAPVFTSNLAPHHAWRIEKLSWEYIYKNWPKDTLQYYWRDYPALHGPSEAEWQQLAEGLNKQQA